MYSGEKEKPPVVLCPAATFLTLPAKRWGEDLCYRYNNVMSTMSM